MSLDTDKIETSVHTAALIVAKALPPHNGEPYRGYWASGVG